MNNKQWFREAGYGMMIHWGLYALIGGEWRGRRMDYIGEWSQSYFRIPNETYGKLAGAFNPIEFRAEDWVTLARDSGMKYMVVTSKHHDGFALFRSAADAYNICDATPFGRDVIAELAEACYKHGIKLGLYYSQDLDWHEPDGGGYTRGHTNAGMSWTNDWDYPDNDNKDYTRCYESKIKPQLKEILTNYGDLCLIWFDTPATLTEIQSRELYDMVKHYQPDCLVNSRLGNKLGDYRSWGDNEIPDEYMHDGLYESPATLNRTWGYKAFDVEWKQADEVRRIRRHLNERGINYLLNVGPDHLGRIPAPACDILRATKD
ncbi:MAG: alpha-L-fucosidase [Eubacteriales bacterium]|jgi:alpha-L-fucosidase|nr:alpha-L-fucosidase [Eubacteriales bacterium]